MEKRRSEYVYELNFDPSVANNLIQGFIQANKFVLMVENGEQFYKGGDGIVTSFKYFNYSITDKKIVIYAWYKGRHGEVPIELEPETVSYEYRNLLHSLFKEIESLNNGVVVNIDNNTNNNLEHQNQNIQYSQVFENRNKKRYETLCEISFWLSIVGLIMSFSGQGWGLLMYVLIIWFACLGLKTRKKGKAIATIVISAINILILILWIIGVLY